MVILQFPSMAQVQAWFADPAYQEAKALARRLETLKGS